MKKRVKKARKKKAEKRGKKSRIKKQTRRNIAKPKHHKHALKHHKHKAQKKEHHKKHRIKKQKHKKSQGLFGEISSAFKWVVFGEHEIARVPTSHPKVHVIHHRRHVPAHHQAKPAEKEPKPEKAQKEIIEKAKETHEEEKEQPAQETKEETSEGIKPKSEKEKQAEKEEEKEQLKKMLTQKKGLKIEGEDKTGKKKVKWLDMFSKKSKVSQEDLDEALRQWESVVPAMNLSDEIKKKIKENLSKSMQNVEVKKEKMEKRIEFALRDAVSSLIPETPDFIKQVKAKKGQFTILFIGPHGSGKTTSIPKVAGLLQKNEISCILAAADTTNAESIDQLEAFAKRLDMPITRGGQGTDPSIIAAETKKYAKENEIQCVLIDTAADTSQSSSLKKIAQTISTDITMLVIQSASNSQDSVEQAKTFNSLAEISGVIITKTDKQDESGAALSISYALKKPVYFIGTGEDIPDIRAFDKEAFLKKLRLG